MLTISTLSHSFVAFDRYLFIVHPMKYQVYVTTKATSIVTIVVMVIASLLSALTLIIRSDFHFLQEAGMCIGPPIWAVLYLFMIFIPSLTVALFAYQRIWQLCSSIFRQDDLGAKRGGHSPRLSLSNQIPAFSLSSKSHSTSNLSLISDVAELHITERCGGTMEKNFKTEDNSLTEQCVSSITVTTHHTKVTRKNTTTTTTIATRPCDIDVPVEDPFTQFPEDIQQKITPERRFSQITEVEVEEIISTERRRTQSVTVQKTSLTQANVKPHEISIVSESVAQSNSPPTNSQTITIKTDSDSKRTQSKDSIIPFLKCHTRDGSYPNPRIITTSVKSINSVVNMGRPKSVTPIPTPANNASLSILDTFHAVKNSNHPTSYDTVTRKLFGSEAILPSLLYVAILMPLSMRPVSSNLRNRRLRVCLLIGLPVLMMAVSFLPFPGSLIYLGYRYAGDSNTLSNGVIMDLIKTICHLTYALVPSLTSFLLCLNNRPYRRALRQTFRGYRCF